MSSESHQLVVVGAGPGGYAAAFLAADLGISVALIDDAPNPGGVCLYRGCIPSKALLHVARVMTEVEEVATMGVTYGKPQLDVDKLRAWKDDVVARQTGGLGQLVKARKIQYLRGRAQFLDARTLEISGEGGAHKVRFDHAIIATGSHPATVPSLQLDSPNVLNSTTALDIESVPKSLLVVGGGYIGLEMGTVYAALGTKVTVVEMMPGLLPGADRDLVRVLARRLDGRFERVLLETRVTEMKAHKSGITVTFDGKEETYEKVLVSVGRKPNSSGLGLDNTAAVVDARGFIQVNQQLRTAEPSIYAIGDVVGEPMLAHKASHQGRVAVEAIAGEKVAFEPAAIPAVVFTDPEIAWCGLTESQARQEGREVRVVRFPWAASGRATTLERNDGMTKLIVDPGSERVLGVGMVGTGAGELIAEGVLAVEMAATVTDMRLTIHPHPTLAETVMEAAEVYFGTATHVYRPRKTAKPKPDTG